MKPLIDLFMLTWNRCEYTAMTLKSLETIDSGVSWDDVHFTVIDQASTDDNLKVLNACAVVDEIITLPTNLGVAGGMDYFRRECLHKGPYVSKIDNDSIFTPDWLGKMFRALKAWPGLGLVGAAQGNRKGPGLVVNKDGAGFYPASFIGGRFLCRRAAFNASNIRGKGLYGWQAFQRKHIKPKWKIGWCHPPAVIQHVGDWNERHPLAIKNLKYRKYMQDVGRAK